MKLFWKLLISIESIILIIFAVFGCFLMYFSFSNSIDREKEQANQQIILFQYSMLTALGNLPKDYYGKSMVITGIAENIQNNISREGDVLKVYDARKEVLYETTSYPSELVTVQLAGKPGASIIRECDGQYYIESLLLLQEGTENYYIEIDKNITYIYNERNQLLDSYRMALVIALCISLGLAVVLSLNFTRPIRGLSLETKWFAEGNYKRRVTVKGNDEITDLMKSFNHMAETIEQSMRELAEDARRQEDFTAAFAHELKTPLTSVIGYADMLRSQDMSVEDRLMSADYIFQQGKRLERLSYKLLELVGMKKNEIQTQQISMPLLWERLEKMTAEILKEKKITLCLKVKPGYIYGDIDLLMSLFGNLIDNARKACNLNGNIWVIGVSTEHTYCIFIQDDGRGIPKEEIHKITEAFYMVDKSRARKEGGAGIGMTLCKRIIELHDAKWQINSKVGIGTRVTIDFPLEQKEGEK